jgi:tRNA pseudouridine55 synthase
LKLTMDGLLVVDKPLGPSSHDVVARVRRVLNEQRIGHTGTLDPAASGVLPLVIGRATRLAQFMVGASKAYDAVVRLGVATTTFDAQGAPVGAAYAGTMPGREAVEQAVDSFRGTFLQQPPAYSAKKIGGEPSYKRARRAARQGTAQASADVPLPVPVQVTVHGIELLDVEGGAVRLHIECSAGFYVRVLAHDLGLRLGTGGHLASLRRTRSGDWTLDHAIALDALEQPESGRRTAEAMVIPMDRLLESLPAVVLTDDGMRRTANGCEVGPDDSLSGFAEAPDKSKDKSGHVRLVSSRGALVAIARPGRTPGSLHPLVVLM